MYSNQINYILQPNYLCIITNLVMYKNQLIYV